MPFMHEIFKQVEEENPQNAVGDGDSTHTQPFYGSLDFVG